MEKSENSSSNILMAPIEGEGESGDLLWFRILGKATFHNSPKLKKAFRLSLEAGTLGYVVDLADCVIMDSTFMGTLTAMALQLRKVEGATLDIVNASDRNIQLLESLGLDHILDIDRAGSRLLEERERAQGLLKEMKELDSDELSKEQKGQLVLEAHEALSKVVPENKQRFRDVLEFLRDVSKEEE